MFKRILARLDVFPPFLDFVLAFGFKLEPQDENFGGLHRRIYCGVELGKGGGCPSFGNRVSCVAFPKPFYVYIWFFHKQMADPRDSQNLRIICGTQIGMEGI
jgi:hypothetical protein